MRQVCLAMLGMLALALSIAGCGPRQTDVYDGYSYPCGPLGLEGGHLGLERHVLKWTPDGSQLIFPHEKTIWIVDVTGVQLDALVNVNPDHSLGYGFHADISPDGTRIVYATCEFHSSDSSFVQREDYNYEIAVINFDGTGSQRLTMNRILDYFPVWSPDGSRIAYISNPRGASDHTNELFTMTTDGSDVQNVLSSATPARNSDRRLYGRVVLAPPMWSPPDGNHLAFLVNEGSNIPYRHILYTVDLDGTALTRIAEVAGQLTDMNGNLVPILPSWSPDGERLAFVMADEKGKPAGVYTIRPNATDLRQVLQPQEPMWSITQVLWAPDGSEILAVSGKVLYFFGPDGSGLRTINLDVEPNDYLGIIAAWSPDGSRIAIYTPGYGLDVPPQLFTVARNGSDRRTLVEGTYRRIVAANSDWRDVTADIEACDKGFVVQNPAENASLVQECRILLTIRDTLAGDIILNWSAESPITTWEGVWVEGSPLRVRRLALGGTSAPHLNGVVPPELGDLSELELLSLNTRFLSGGIPPELGKLVNLRSLQLSSSSWSTGLEGSIPPELGNLTNLLKLYLFGNRLEGSIPPELGNLTNLTDLSLSNNLLVGPLPPELGKLRQLEYVRLINEEYDRNVFSGCVPTEFLDIWVEASGLQRCAN